MIIVPIHNEEVLNILQDYKWTYSEKYKPQETNMFIQPDEEDRNHWVGKDYLNELINIGREHNGSPPAAMSYAIKPDHYHGDDKTDYYLDYMSLDGRMKSALGLQTCALNQLYPPGGFIGWHTNENASAYNLIFTWSETGDGYFEYVDPKTKELVRVQDKKGWTCKAGYFGSSYEPDRIVYHCASTECWRMTVSYTLGFNEEYWRDVIEDISTP